MHLNTFQQPFRGLQINRTHPLAKNLIGYWPCNDGTGLKAWDYSGNANQGTLEGTAPTWKGGQRGYAVNLPGTDERIDCGNDAPLDQIGNGSFWISFWMKSKDTIPLANSTIFTKDQLDGQNRIYLMAHASNNRMALYIEKNNIVYINIVPFSATITPYDTEWNHIVFVINRITDKALLYMNTIKGGVEIDLSSLPADISNTGNVAWGASSVGGTAYEGALDKMRIYTGLPTQEIINQLYWEPYAIFRTWRRRYQFFPERIFLSFTGQTPGITMAGNAPEVTITGDRG